MYEKCVPFYQIGTICSEFRIPSGTDWTLMDDSRTIVPKNVFLLITWEPIVPSSESRAEQIGPLMEDMRTIVPKNVFLLITWERVFFIKIRNKMVI